MVDKKKLCEPCQNFKKSDWFYGWGCTAKNLQLGEMNHDNCGEDNCFLFKRDET